MRKGKSSHSTIFFSFTQSIKLRWFPNLSDFYPSYLFVFPIKIIKKTIAHAKIFSSPSIPETVDFTDFPLFIFRSEQAPLSPQSLPIHVPSLFCFLDSSLNPSLYHFLVLHPLSVQPVTWWYHSISVTAFSQLFPTPPPWRFPVQPKPTSPDRS